MPGKIHDRRGCAGGGQCMQNCKSRLQGYDKYGAVHISANVSAMPRCVTSGRLTQSRMFGNPKPALWL